MDLSIDHQSLELTCPECEEEFLIIRGSVFEARQPVGLYLIALHSHAPGGPVAHLALGLIDPADEAADPEDADNGAAVPTAVAMDVVPADGDFGFAFVDWRDSPWQTESYIGDQIDRSEAVEHPRRPDFFEVAGYVARNLPDLGDYLFPS